MLDNLIRLADQNLGATQNGGIEKVLTGAIDSLEAGLDKVVDSAEKLAAAPEMLLEKAEAKQEQVAGLVQHVQQHTAKTIDIIQK